MCVVDIPSRPPFAGHLGDVVRPEPTLFDAILDPAIPHDDNGWKQYLGLPWPHLTFAYIYHYDTNGDNVGSSGEPLLTYNKTSGSFSVFWIP